MGNLLRDGASILDVLNIQVVGKGVVPLVQMPPKG
jgi:hypothetical protein